MWQNVLICGLRALIFTSLQVGMFFDPWRGVFVNSDFGIFHEVMFSLS